MDKKKKWMIVASILIGAGIIITGIGLCGIGFDFMKLETARYETSSYKITESFENIYMKTDLCDVEFVPSEDEECKVVCFEREKEAHKVVVEDNTLTICQEDNRKWYDYIGFHLKSMTITVYLPETEYKSLVIEKSTVDLEMRDDFTFETVTIENTTGDTNWNGAVEKELVVITDTGDVKINGITPEKLFLKTDIGEISLRDVKATGKIEIETDTGDIIFQGCDAPEIYMKTEIGDIEGTLLSNKIFTADTDLGDIDVPKSKEGGVCEVSTDTGDIEIDIK